MHHAVQPVQGIILRCCTGIQQAGDNCHTVIGKSQAGTTVAGLLVLDQPVLGGAVKVNMRQRALGIPHGVLGAVEGLSGIISMRCHHVQHCGRQFGHVVGVRPAAVHK